MESLDDRTPVVENGLEANNFSHDIEAIIEQIWHKFMGATSREEILEMVTEAASEYENVRIRTYVPIFLYRDVMQRLGNDPDRRQSGEVPARIPQGMLIETEISVVEQP
jgi:hypothetical protein